MAKFYSISLQFFNKRTFLKIMNICFQNLEHFLNKQIFSLQNCEHFLTRQTFYDLLNILFQNSHFLNFRTFFEFPNYLWCILEYSNFCQENNSRKSYTCTHLHAVFFSVPAIHRLVRVQIVFFYMKAIMCCFHWLRRVSNSHLKKPTIFLFRTVTQNLKYPNKKELTPKFSWVQFKK